MRSHACRLYCLPSRSGRLQPSRVSAEPSAADRHSASSGACERLGKRVHSSVPICRDFAGETRSQVWRLLSCARRMTTNVNCMEELNRANSAAVARSGLAGLISLSLSKIELPFTWDRHATCRIPSCKKNPRQKPRVNGTTHYEQRD